MRKYRGSGGDDTRRGPAVGVVGKLSAAHRGAAAAAVVVLAVSASRDVSVGPWSAAVLWCVVVVAAFPSVRAEHALAPVNGFPWTRDRRYRRRRVFLKFSIYLFVFFFLFFSNIVFFFTTAAGISERSAVRTYFLDHDRRFSSPFVHTPKHAFRHKNKIIINK